MNAQDNVFLELRSRNTVNLPCFLISKFFQEAQLQLTYFPELICYLQCVLKLYCIVKHIRDSTRFLKERFYESGPQL